MPQLSCFTPCGQLECSSDDSDAQKIYNALIAAQNGKGQNNFDMTVGGHFEASTYARAMAIGAARGAVKRAGNQRNPLKSYDMLPSLEKDYGVLPGVNDTIPKRQANVAARRLLPNGALPWNIAAQLRAVLGTDFLGYYPCGSSPMIPPSASVDLTVTPSTMPNLKANAVSAQVLPKWLQLIDPVVQVGAAWTVAYGMLDPSVPLTPLLVGEVVMVQGECGSQREAVTVTAVGTETVGGVVYPAFTATFLLAHDIGATVTNMNFPVQSSTARSALIAVGVGSVYNITKCNAVHAVMARIEREIGQWAIVAATPAGPGFINIEVCTDAGGIAETNPTFILNTVPMGNGNGPFEISQTY